MNSKTNQNQTHFNPESKDEASTNNEYKKPPVQRTYNYEKYIESPQNQKRIFSKNPFTSSDKRKIAAVVVLVVILLILGIYLILKTR